MTSSSRFQVLRALTVDIHLHIGSYYAVNALVPFVVDDQLILTSLYLYCRSYCCCVINISYLDCCISLQYSGTKDVPILRSFLLVPK